MHYMINNDVVRTENCAKPVSQASKDVIKAIEAIPNESEILDYGCGKLRYFHGLYTKANALTLVDSEIQLFRRQLICGVETTIKDYVKEFPKTCICPAEQFNCNEKYDFILLSNVLSCIPGKHNKLFVLEKLKNAVKKTGEVLIINQYTNSDFNIKKRGLQIYEDGYIIKKNRNISFYSVIDKSDLEILIRYSNMKIKRFERHGQSYHCYVN